MRISVIGTGYLGAVHAACMAELGHEVLGVDIDEFKIGALADGRAPFYEPGLNDMLARVNSKGRLRFSTSLEEAARFAQVHFVCVGTPQRPGGLGADLSYLESVIDGLVPYFTNDCLVVGKSTVPVGTAQRLTERIAQLSAPGVTTGLAWNPEFLREGFAIEDTLRPDRLVAGVTSDAADKVLREVYADLLAAGTPYIVTDLATAELTKVAANSFLATKISFINSVADVCDAVGADVGTLADALGYDSRIGRRFLSAGLGFGGGCLTKDVRAFIARANELGLEGPAGLLEHVERINAGRRIRATTVARDLVEGDFTGRNVAVLGAAFKPLTDDIRDSPALAVAMSILAEGASVTVHDPQALDNARLAYPELAYADKVEEVLRDADVVLHLTEWNEYRELDPKKLVGLVRKPRILDGRNVLHLPAWQAAGWTVRSLGTTLPPSAAEDRGTRRDRVGTLSAFECGQ